MAATTMTLRELIDALEKLDEEAKRTPTIIGDVNVRIISGPWSASLVGVALYPSVGYVVLRAE